MAQDIFRTFDQDLQRLLAAGSGSAAGDEGLFKAKDGFDKLAARVPALAAASEQVGKVLGAKGRAAASELLNLSAMNLKLRGAQAKPSAEGELAPLPPMAPLETGTPQHDLEAIHRALTSGTLPSGKKINRQRTIEDAAERGVIRDLRLLDLWVRALGDASIGEQVAEKVIPQLGEAAAARIELQFNLLGKTADARRLECIVAIRGERARALVERCLKGPEAAPPAPADEKPVKGKKAKKEAPREMSVEVRAAAVRALEKVAPGEAEARARSFYQSEKNQEVRAACVGVMGAGEGAETLEILMAALRDSGDVNEAAVAALQRFRHASTTERVLALLTPELLDIKPYKAPKAKANQKLTKAQTQANQKAEQQAQRAIAERSELVERVIRVLGKRPSTAVLDRLIELFRKHPIESIRQAAGEALKASGERRALEILVERLNEDDYEMESLAVWAFFHLDMATVFERMQPYLTEQALANKKGLATAKKLLEEISGSGYYLEQAVEEEKEEDKEEGKEEDLAALVGAADTEADDQDARWQEREAARKMALFPFRRDPRWGAVALRLLGHKDLASTLANILGNLKERKAVDPLLELLRKDQGSGDAALALVSIGDRAVIPKLIELLPLKGPRPCVIGALGSLKATEAVDKLCELLSKEADEKYQIFEALQHIDDKRAAVPVAKALMLKSVNSYPYQAIRTLRQLDDPAVVPHVQEAVKKSKKSKNAWLVSQYEELITYLERDRKV